MYNEALFNAYEREHELLARLERQDGDLEGLEDYTRELEGAVEDLQFDVRNMEDEIAILKADLDASKSLEASDLIYMIRLEEGNAVLRGQAERDLWTIKALEDQVGELDCERDELREALADPKPIRTLSYVVPEDYLGEDPNPEFTSFLRALIYGGKL